MSGGVRVVPWICIEEWKQIYCWLYSEDKQTQKQALDRVIAWRSRCKLPVGVECTAAFVECQLHRARGQARGLDIQLSLALAIVRFVNGITDLHQTGAFAKSVVSLANELGLPEWLVDIRHDATHKILPSIELLNRGCEEALKWLKINYWEAQIRMIQQNEMTQRQLKDNIHSILSTYIHFQLQHKVKGERKRKRKSKSQDEILRHLASTVNRIDEGNTVLIELLSTNYLVQKHGNESASSEHELESFQLPSVVVDLWHPLLQHFHVNSKRFTPQLLANLIKTASSLSVDSQFTHLTYSWILQLITWASQSDFKDQVLSTPLTLNWPSVIQLCLQYPGKYSKMILEHLKSCTHETQLTRWIEKAKTLIGIYINAGDSDTSTSGNNQGKEWTVEHLAASSTSTWVQCEDSFSWAMSPIGLAPHQTMTSNMFRLAIPDKTDSDEDTDEDTEQETAEIEGERYESEEHETDTVSSPKGWTDQELQELQQQIRLF